MANLLWIAAGAIAGLLGGPAGALAGAVLGGLVASLRREQAQSRMRQDERIAALERELAALSAQLGARPAPPPAAPAVAAAATRELDLDLDLPAVAPAPAAAPAATRDTATAAERFDLDPLYARCRDWLLGGNTLVRVGILVLFFGLTFLARYAVEHALLPPALRLAGIAAAGSALAAIGWRLREQRRGYALTLQGGGVAVLYLTVFAAFRLYGLLPPGAAFGLMLVMVAVAAWFAVRQDAAPLAVIGTAGGFAAPILASTGGGTHVELFTYYALLNTGVLALAWWRAWRSLNLTGFLFTFAIGLAWGAGDYHPWHFATTEPFLILFCLMYVAAAVAYAWKHAPSLRDPVDGTLVFGVPVVGFGLQAALVHGMPNALAWSAAAVGIFYLLLAAVLHRLRRPPLALLVKSFTALGIAFLTLAIPLAFDGRWSAAAWALEGAALWWVGLQQQRRLAAASGLLLQAGAGLLFAADLAQHPGLRGFAVLNSAFLGTTMIAGAGFVSAWLADRQTGWPAWLRPIGRALLAWAWLWWLVGGWAEIDTQVLTGTRPAAHLLLFAVSGALAVALAPRLGWADLQFAVALPAAGMLLALAQATDYGVPPSGHGGWLAWPLALALHGLALRRADAHPARALLSWTHAAGVWLIALALSQEVGRQVAALDLGNGWKTAAFAAPAVLVLAALAWRADCARWPLSGWRGAYLCRGGMPLAAGLALWSLAILPLADGNAWPLAYLPVLNPLDLCVAALLGSIAWWLRRARAGLEAVTGPIRTLQAGLAVITFIGANAALLRGVHHATGLPWDLARLLAADTTQTALSLFWAALGLGLMLLANRRASRPMWLAGAGLMAAVVAKLFLVDMAASGTLTRIVSFIGAGLLLLVVGYFSPLPPRQPVNDED
ncbi:DUF2339 domain-containing protein [Thauera sinica]|uniref:DUF2339 domain-containing protein n=1 Tax=Thauera sinica TaxID=2665146 RepID=A0ABW1ARF5_9RHOO|nr:DUF2339 domain-containing protein [Thauera sp. K11]ATE62135.1 hypothetical protein CCZ27_21090 [Thauera sp. K11]